MNEKQAEQAQKPQSPPAKNKSGINKWVAIMLFVLLMIALGLLIALWMSSQDKEQNLDKKNKSLQSQVDKLKKQLKDEKAKSAAAMKDSEEAPAASCPDVSDELKANIEAAVTSKNYAALAGYMANPLTVVYAASEFGGNKTPDEAVAAMDYLNDAGTWDFELSSDVIASYQDGDYEDYFSDTVYVGKSSKGLVVSFDFECGEISQIFISASDEIL